MANINKGLTVMQLYKECQAQIIKGNEDKHVQISCDDEGNGFHSLFYGFTDTEEALDCFMNDGLMPYGIDSTEDIVILG